MKALGLFYQGKRGDIPPKNGTRALLEHWFPDDVPPPAEALEYLLDATIERFGHTSRDVYSGIFLFKDVEERHDSGAVTLEDLRNTASSLVTRKLSAFQLQSVSHRFIALSPVFHELGDVDCGLEPKSDWVAKQFMDLLESADDNEVRRQIAYFRQIPQMNSVAGSLLEPLIHWMLADTSTGDSWSLHAMSSANDGLTVRAVEEAVPSDVQFAKVKRDRKRFHDLPEFVEDGCYYWHYAGNSSFFDAFTAEINGTSAVLWIV